MQGGRQIYLYKADIKTNRKKRNKYGKNEEENLGLWEPLTFDIQKAYQNVSKIKPYSNMYLVFMTHQLSSYNEAICTGDWLIFCVKKQKDQRNSEEFLLAAIWHFSYLFKNKDRKRKDK